MIEPLSYTKLFGGEVVQAPTREDLMDKINEIIQYLNSKNE